MRVVQVLQTQKGLKVKRRWLWRSIVGWAKSMGLGCLSLPNLRPRQITARHSCRNLSDVISGERHVFPCHSGQMTRVCGAQIELDYRGRLLGAQPLYSSSANAFVFSIRLCLLLAFLAFAIVDGCARVHSAACILTTLAQSRDALALKGFSLVRSQGSRQTKIARPEHAST